MSTTLDMKCVGMSFSRRTYGEDIIHKLYYEKLILDKLIRCLDDTHLSTYLEELIREVLFG